jgi:hypothetical protein
MIVPMAVMPRVTAVEILEGFKVRLTFKDGTVGSVDLADIIGEGPIFEPLQDRTYFGKVRVNRTLGTIVWPNGADVAPETLYARVVGTSTAA